MIGEQIRSLAEKMNRGASIYSPEVYEPLVQAYAHKPTVVLDRVGVLTPMFGDGHLLEQAVPALHDLKNAGYQIVIWTGEPRGKSQTTFTDVSAMAGPQIADGILTVCKENWLPQNDDDYDYVINHAQNRGALSEAQANEVRHADVDQVLMRIKPHFLFFPTGTPLIDDSGDQYSCNLAGPLPQYPNVRPIGVPENGLFPKYGTEILKNWPIIRTDIISTMDPTPRPNVFSQSFLRQVNLTK